MTKADDILLLKGISFEANHGAFAPERRFKRRFEVDLEVHAHLARSAMSDRLADTVDYHALCEIVVAVGTGKTYKLIEKLARAILSACTDRYPQAAFSIEVRKIAPQCPGAPLFSAVRMSRGPLKA